jgi:hypothetical protein
MQLTLKQSYDVLAKHRVFARKCCDKCGQLLGAVRFTRMDEVGEWCSRECRGDGERQAARKGGRRGSIGASKIAALPRRASRGNIVVSPCGKNRLAACKKQTTYRRENGLSRLPPLPLDHLCSQGDSRSCSWSI